MRYLSDINILYKQLNDLNYDVKLIPMLGIEGTLLVNIVEHLMTKNNNEIIVIRLKTLCELLNCHHSKVYSILNTVIQSYTPLNIEKFKLDEEGLVTILFQKIL